MGPWNRKKKMTTPRFTSKQKRTLTILTSINFLNYIDRDIIFGLVPIIQARFGVSYSQAGLLNTVFSIVHSVCTLPLGWVADRFSRRKVICYGVLFWTLATFLSGLAPTFRSLLLARGLVGVGEAAYAPAATAIITGSFPRRVRARVQGVFDLGMFVGGAIGIALGPVLMGWVGWQAAFFVVGIPGILLAKSILGVEEPRVESPEKRVPIRHILRVPAFVWVLIGGWFINLAVYSYIFWGTTFVHTYKGFGVREASILLGVTVTFAGIFGVLTGATLADRLARIVPWGRILVVGMGFLVSTPLLFWSFHATNKTLFVILFFLGSFFMTWYHGPLTAIMHDLIPERAHATAVGLYLFVAHFFATTWAPLLIGKVADRYDLLTGMHLALVAQLAGVVSYALVIYFIRRDGLHHPSMAAYREADPAADPDPGGSPASSESRP